MNNRSLDVILEIVEDEQLRERLATALVERDDRITEGLMSYALAQGLKPSITRILLLQAGLGNVEPEAYSLLLNQAEREQAELERMAEEFRRRFGGG